MISMAKITGSLLVVTLLVFGCQNGENNNVNLGERPQIEENYYVIQHMYDSLITKYQAQSDLYPVDLHTSYGQMQRMHQQMETSHERLLDEIFGCDEPAKSRKTGAITVHMRGHVTGEWYVEMQNMHNSIAIMHSELGQKSMAELHKELAKEYEIMVRRGTTDPPFDNYSLLDKGASDVRSCSSCHGDIITKWLSAEN